MYMLESRVTTIVSYSERIVTSIVEESHWLCKTVDYRTTDLVYGLSVQGWNYLVDLEVLLSSINIVNEYENISLAKYSKALTY